MRILTRATLVLLALSLSVLNQGLGGPLTLFSITCPCADDCGGDTEPCEDPAGCPACPSCSCCAGIPTAVVARIQVDHVIETLRIQEPPVLLAAPHPDPHEILHVPRQV